MFFDFSWQNSLRLQLLLKILVRSAGNSLVVRTNLCTGFEPRMHPKLILALGDNFYPCGVQSEHDPQFRTVWQEIFLSHQESAPKKQGQTRQTFTQQNVMGKTLDTLVWVDSTLMKCSPACAGAPSTMESVFGQSRLLWQSTDWWPLCHVAKLQYIACIEAQVDFTKSPLNPEGLWQCEGCCLYNY
eukprot:4566020-Amphidinium_carterae.1